MRTDLLIAPAQLLKELVGVGLGAEPPSLPSSRETSVTTLLLSLRARTELLRCWSPRGLRCLSTTGECSKP